MRPALGLVLALAAALWGCARPEPPSPRVAPAPAARPSGPEVTVVVLGDSLAAGDGLPESHAFPARLQERLRSEGLNVRVLNAGVSGDTSRGGLERLGWLLRQEPDVLVLELGANDGLRGLPLDQTEANLRLIAERSRAAGAQVLLCGMRVPTSMGADYAEAFAAAFPRLAADLGLPLVPFLLEGVAMVPELNLPDGIHPTAEGQRRLAETVLPHLRPLLPEPNAPN